MADSEISELSELLVPLSSNSYNLYKQTTFVSTT